MEIQIRVDRRMRGLRSRTIKAKLKKALRGLGFRDRELSILLTDNERISELNKRYLGREGPTNVIAFPMEEGEPGRLESMVMGDIVISVETALAEAEMVNETLEQAVLRLLAHGILHLLHYDHETSPRDAARMRREERRVVALMEEE
ncbi:MAG: rRNA maturation RNase YbeY [Desulfobacteraceae bacterium]|nr:MAG: rRNA maturation RNase YbeY [Desulfobacteraceae bacterium]